MATINYNSSNIIKCNDGKYRWVYELNMYNSSVILKECYRVLFIACAAVAFITFFVTLGDGLLNAVKSAFFAGVITTGIFLVLGLVGYFIVALMYNGKYCVVFAMDELGILHAQQHKQVKKAQLIGAITALGGTATGNVGTVGTGILAGTRTKMYSDFSSVKVIEAVPSLKLIRLNSTLDRNQVYAAEEDFDFVLNYIIEHCPKARVK